MPDLYKKINKVEKEIDGKVVTKHYTNFYLAVKIGENVKYVPIAPKNFGKELNKQGYAILSNAAKLLEESPF